jgi:hypothetical protein
VFDYLRLSTKERKMFYSEYLYNDTNIVSILENLQIIRGVFFNHNGDSENQLNSKAKAQLITAIDYLDEIMDSLPDLYKKEMTAIIKAARFRLSHIKMNNE